jgi:hypothetical protein
MISHSGFHQRIIEKYQKGGSNPFRFPLMIFHKSALNILLRFHFHNRVLISSFMGKNTYNMERLFSWFKAERLKNVYDLNPMVFLNKPDTKALPLPQSRVARDENISRYSRIQKEKGIVWGPYSHRTSISAAIARQVRLQPWTIVQKSWRPPSHATFGFQPANAIALQSPFPVPPGRDSFYFRRPAQSAQDVAELKKIVVNTQEIVTHQSQIPYPSLEGEIKKHLDLNRLAEQVYQTIERKIRRERERRGL